LRARFDPALSVGDTWLLTALWHRLCFGESFGRVLRNGRSSFDCERLLRVMVFNCLGDPPPPSTPMATQTPPPVATANSPT